MTYTLWNRHGGSPSHKEGDIAVGASTVNTTILSVAAGKRIIPMWFFIWGGGGAAQRFFTLRGVDTLDAQRSTVLVDNAQFYAAFMQPLAFKWNLEESNVFADGEDLRLTIGTGTGGEAYKYALGYYLVDT